MAKTVRWVCDECGKRVDPHDLVQPEITFSEGSFQLSADCCTGFDKLAHYLIAVCVK